MELSEFLAKRLDEDEAVAREVGYGQIDVTDYLWSTKVLSLHAPDGRIAHTQEIPGDLAIHIARHDPARVLREVAAKRKLLKQYEEAAIDLNEKRDAAARELTQTAVTQKRYAAAMRYVDALEIAVALMAAAYDDSPDFDPAWRVE